MKKWTAYGFIIVFYLMQIIGRDCVYYYHDMIVEMIKWGFQEGKTLFGFGYDFRQSNRYLLNYLIDVVFIILSAVFVLMAPQYMSYVLWPL